MFHSSSIVILHEIQKGVAILVIGTALSLPLSACTGLLVGLHKNEIPALAIGASRLLGALTVIVCARYNGSLMILALCFTELESNRGPGATFVGQAPTSFAEIDCSVL